MSERQRLFFALWPDDERRRALAKLQRKAVRGRGRLVAAENLHVTLFFLGSTDAQRRACAERVAARVRAPAFTMTLERLGHFPKPQVLWSAPALTPEPLHRLVRGLGEGLAGCGFTPDPRPYRAHLTLARKVGGRIPEATHEPIEWTVEAFALVESRTHARGVEYRPLAFWPLAPQ